MLPLNAQVNIIPQYPQCICYPPQTYRKANTILILFENLDLQNNVQWYF